MTSNPAELELEDTPYEFEKADSSLLEAAKSLRGFAARGSRLKEIQLHSKNLHQTAEAAKSEEAKVEDKVEAKDEAKEIEEKSDGAKAEEEENADFNDYTVDVISPAQKKNKLERQSQDSINDRTLKTLTTLQIEDSRIKEVIDGIWNQYELEPKAMLDKEQVRDFVQNHLGKLDLVESVDEIDLNLDTIFEKYDDDKNGLIEQEEMANFLNDIIKNN